MSFAPFETLSACACVVAAPPGDALVQIARPRVRLRSRYPTKSGKCFESEVAATVAHAVSFIELSEEADEVL